MRSRSRRMREQMPGESTTIVECEVPRAGVDRSTSSQALRRSGIACAAALSALFVYITIRSLPTRIELDSPVMLYMGFLMDRYHEAPYRDWFDMNLPGSYLLFLLLG